MSQIFVSGLVNTETTVAIVEFPIPYQPAHYNFHGVKTTVSGVGWNIAKALKTLGDDVCFAGLVGEDVAAKSIRSAFRDSEINEDGLLSILKDTPQSAILFDKEGRRSIHTDLKDIQDSEYPLDKAEKLMQGADAAVICNINFSRPLLSLAKQLGIPVFTDVHAISSIDDEYNQDFMESSDVLFFSHENIGRENVKSFINQIVEISPKKSVVCGLGKEGAMYWDHETEKICRQTGFPQKRVKNSVGAGDALMSGFVHFYTGGRSIEDSLRLSQKFASEKIRASGGAEGFLTEEELLAL